jgi:hypothetical protein
LRRNDLESDDLESDDLGSDDLGSYHSESYHGANKYQRRAQDRKETRAYMSKSCRNRWPRTCAACAHLSSSGLPSSITLGIFQDVSHAMLDRKPADFHSMLWGKLLWRCTMSTLFWTYLQECRIIKNQMACTLSNTPCLTLHSPTSHIQKSLFARCHTLLVRICRHPWIWTWKHV